MTEWKEYAAEQEGDVADWLNGLERDGYTVVFVAMAHTGDGWVLVIAKAKRDE